MCFFSKLRLLAAATVALAAASAISSRVRADVVVLSNRTSEKIPFSLVQPDGKVSVHTLLPRDVMPIPLEDRIGIAFDSADGPRRYLIRENSINFFLIRDEKLEMVGLRLQESEEGDQPPTAPEKTVRMAPLCTIPVMLLVDDNEPAVRSLWEKRLRDRLAEASAIFERYCRVRFEVAAIGRWDSDDNVFDFGKSLREFELEVTPAPAKLAIGFTSQYRITKGRTHLGGTRGALYSHILIREWSQHITKSERLEVLVHELGHYLGATHSPAYDSVMRPTLGDHLSHARDFRIGFDPLNTMIMYLLGEEMRTRQIRHLRYCRPETKTQLRTLYQTLAKLMPKDPASKRYLEILDSPPYARRAPDRHPSSLTKATKAVVQAISRAAGENRSAAGGAQLSGDRLTEFYVRRAAAAAGELPAQRAQQAFLLGVGIGLSRSSALRMYPVAGGLCRDVESGQDRHKRLRDLGAPTVHGRSDLLEHFVVSAVLTSLVGADAAETAGIVKELNDSRRGSKFSFVDLTADIAGATFATHVAQSKLPLDRLAKSFTVDRFLPDPGELEQGISWNDFLERYNSPQDDRFRRRQQAIRERVAALPGYRAGGKR